MADLSRIKERTCPQFRGLLLYIGSKSLPLTSPTPACTPSQPTALRTREKRRASDSQERGGGDGGGDRRLTPTAKALSPSVLGVLVLVHLQPSSVILPLATLIYFPFPAESSIFNLYLPHGSSRSIDASFLLPPSIHSFQTLTPFLWI